MVILCKFVKAIWYVRDEQLGECRLIDVIRANGENKKYLPGVKIANNIIVSDDPVSVSAAADVIFFAYATRHVTEILEKIKGHLRKDVTFVSFSKVNFSSW